MTFQDKGEPFFFDASLFPQGNENALFGCYHAPAEGTPATRGVVLCYPFGREYIQAHRACRQLALRLARRGAAVLRFDYYGTGDSNGQDEEVDLVQWRSDTRRALVELSRCSGVTHSVLVGLRLGAAVAAQVAASRGDVEKLVLWEPVLNGRAYLDELNTQHRDMLRRFFTDPGQSASQPEIGEIMGFPMTPALFAELQELDMLLLAAAPAPQILVVTHRQNELLEQWIARLQSLGSRVMLECVTDVTIWQEDPDKGLVPHRSLDAIVNWILG